MTRSSRRAEPARASRGSAPTTSPPRHHRLQLWGDRIPSVHGRSPAPSATVANRRDAHRARSRRCSPTYQITDVRSPLPPHPEHRGAARQRKAAPRQYSRPPTGGTTPLHGRATASTTPTSATPPTTAPSHSAEASALHSRGGPRHPRTGSLNPQRSSGGGALSTPSRRGPACRRSTGTDGSSWPTRRATSSACATAAPGCGSTAGAPGRERRSVPAGVERTLVLTPARDGRAGRRAPRSGTGARPVNYCVYLSTPRSRPEGECS
jgi:hypothetical protein